MGITIAVKGRPPMTEYHREQLQRVVHRNLDIKGTSGLSASGYSLAIAVDYCEDRKLPYTIQAEPGAGYVLTITKETMGQKLTITIEMDNAAFTDDPDAEAGRILAGLADRMIRGGFPDRLPLRDINGNIVGKADITKKVE